MKLPCTLCDLCQTIFVWCSLDFLTSFESFQPIPQQLDPTIPASSMTMHPALIHTHMLLNDQQLLITPPYQWHLSFFHNHLHSRQIWHSSAFGVIHLVCTYLQGEGKSVICICLLFNWHCFYHFCILGRGGGHAKWKAHLAMLQITVVSVSQMKVLSMASWKRIIYWW
jgi:hypothetical protein